MGKPKITASRTVGDLLAAAGYAPVNPTPEPDRLPPLRLVLPFTPSVNTYWRSPPGQKPLISRAGRAYRRSVVSVLAAARVVPRVGLLTLRVRFAPPDDRRRDLDNLLKAMLDALQHGGAYLDDRQVRHIDARMSAPRPGGRAVVVLCPLEPEPADAADDDSDR